MTAYRGGVLVATTLLALTAMPAVADEVDEQSVRGMVVYGSQPYPEPAIVDSPLGRIGNESLLVNVENGGVANVVFALTPKRVIEEAVRKPTTVVMRAREAGFSPHVVALRTGDTLKVDNTGTVGHNISIQAMRNVAENQILYPGDQTTFTPVKSERGPLRVTCSIKSSMAAWILVSDAPYVAVSDENGRFQFRDVAPGEYDVKIWHEKAGVVTGLDLENDVFIATAKGFQVQIQKGVSDLGQIMLKSRLFDAD